MKRQLIHTYDDIISVENLALAWQEFIVGKSSKSDVRIFERDLMDNILLLHQDLVNRSYLHGGYEGFFVNDPKRRHIHKACVRDRLLHHAVYRVLYPFFDRAFIHDSFSCRNGKGVHKAINRFRRMASMVSKNHARTCWALKGDIRKFYASIDHVVLIRLLEETIPDKDVIRLLSEIVRSFRTDTEYAVGLPLGNLTSQLFGNIYMNRFDQWVKHCLKVRHYLRYADDFVFFSEDKDRLEQIIPCIEGFLQTHLKLTLHPEKILLKTIASGMDYLGWVHFTDHLILRKTTRGRALARIKMHPTEETVQSYLGLLKHGNAWKLKDEIAQLAWLCGEENPV